MSHRSAKFYDLRVKAECRYRVEGEVVSTDVKPKPLLDIVKQIEAIFDGEGFYRTSRGICFYLADYQLDLKNKKLLLLVNKSDTTEPDATISNPEIKDRRVLEKPEGYGNDYSAHVLISLTPLAIDENVYPMVYESMRGASIYGTHIRVFMNMLLRVCREQNETVYYVPHPAGVQKDGRPVLVNALHTCELSGQISDDFERDLIAGQLESIELIDYDSKGKVWDQDNTTAETRRIVELDVVKQPQRKLDTLHNIFQRATKDSYEQARVRFKDSRNAPQAVSLFTNDFTLVDDSKYVRKTRINVRTNDKSGFDSIHGEIKNELYKLL